MPPTQSAPFRVRTALAFAVVGFFYLYRLDSPILWNDEADTAAIGQSVLRTGLPLAFDGRNLIATDNCDRTGQGLISALPWLQYYVSAASQAIFGAGTLGTRTLFAFAGLLSFFPLVQLLRPRVAHPLVLTLILLLSPQVLLFQRNARYYSLLILLFTTLLYVVFSGAIRGGRQTASVIGCSLLLFHSNVLAASCAFGSLLLTATLLDRKALRSIGVGGGVGLASWLLLQLVVSPLPDSNPSFLGTIVADPAGWLSQFTSGLTATLLDLDFCNAIPLVAYLLVGGCAFAFRREKVLLLGKEPVVVAVLLALLLQTLLTSAFLGYETPSKFALLRYLPHLILFLPLPLYLVLAGVMPSQRGALALFALLMATNGFGVSAWRTFDPAREWKSSWWGPVYSELLSPPPDALLDVIESVRQSTEATGSTLAVVPESMASDFIYFLGDRFSIHRQLIPGSACEREAIRTLGGEGYSRISKEPDSVILSLTQTGTLLSAFRSRAELPDHRRTGDGTRPELTRHAFFTPQAMGTIFAWYETDHASSGPGPSPPAAGTAH